MDGFRNYDAWKLSTPWDNEPDIELFETFEGKVKYFSYDEQACDEFDKQAREIINDPDYDDEDTEDTIEAIAEDLGLKKDRHDAYEAAINAESDREQAAKDYIVNMKIAERKGK